MNAAERLRVSWTRFGFVRCGHCLDAGVTDPIVDLSGATSVDEARETWNDHLRDVHGMEGPA
ncbi:MAG: hypothetical protein ABEI57_07280 [Halapricum sp.]